MRRWLFVCMALLLPAWGSPAADAAPDEVPAPKALPFREGTLVSPEMVVRVAAVTVCGVALVWVGALGLRRVVMRSQDGDAKWRRIRILETCRLSPRSGLVLVRVRNKEVLLGQSSDGLVLLHVDEARDDAAQT